MLVIKMEDSRQNEQVTPTETEAASSESSSRPSFGSWIRRQSQRSLSVIASVAQSHPRGEQSPSPALSRRSRSESAASPVSHGRSTTAMGAAPVGRSQSADPSIIRVSSTRLSQTMGRLRSLVTITDDSVMDRPSETSSMTAGMDIAGSSVESSSVMKSAAMVRDRWQKSLRKISAMPKIVHNPLSHRVPKLKPAQFKIALRVAVNGCARIQIKPTDPQFLFGRQDRLVIRFRVIHSDWDEWRRVYWAERDQHKQVSEKNTLKGGSTTMMEEEEDTVFDDSDLRLLRMFGPKVNYNCFRTFKVEDIDLSSDLWNGTDDSTHQHRSPKSSIDIEERNTPNINQSAMIKTDSSMGSSLMTVNDEVMIADELSESSMDVIMQTVREQESDISATADHSCTPIPTVSEDPFSSMMETDCESDDSELITSDEDSESSDDFGMESDRVFQMRSFNIGKISGDFTRNSFLNVRFNTSIPLSRGDYQVMQLQIGHCTASSARFHSPLSDELDRMDERARAEQVSSSGVTSTIGSLKRILNNHGINFGNNEKMTWTDLIEFPIPFEALPNDERIFLENELVNFRPFAGINSRSAPSLVIPTRPLESYAPMSEDNGGLSTRILPGSPTTTSSSSMMCSMDDIGDWDGISPGLRRMRTAKAKRDGYFRKCLYKQAKQLKMIGIVKECEFDSEYMSHVYTIEIPERLRAYYEDNEGIVIRPTHNIVNMVTSKSIIWPEWIQLAQCVDLRSPKQTAINLIRLHGLMGPCEIPRSRRITKKKRHTRRGWAVHAYLEICQSELIRECKEEWYNAGRSKSRIFQDWRVPKQWKLHNPMRFALCIVEYCVQSEFTFRFGCPLCSNPEMQIETVSLSPQFHSEHHEESEKGAKKKPGIDEVLHSEESDLDLADDLDRNIGQEESDVDMAEQDEMDESGRMSVMSPMMVVEVESEDGYSDGMTDDRLRPYLSRTVAWIKRMETTNYVNAINRGIKNRRSVLFDEAGSSDAHKAGPLYFQKYLSQITTYCDSCSVEMNHFELNYFCVGESEYLSHDFCGDCISRSVGRYQSMLHCIEDILGDEYNLNGDCIREIVTFAVGVIVVD